MRISDWSSDVCSSDLGSGRRGQGGGQIVGKLRDVVARRSSLTRHDVRRCLQGHAGASPCPARTGCGLPMATIDRQSVVEGKRFSVRVDLVGRRTYNNKTKLLNKVHTQNTKHHKNVSGRLDL